MGEFLNPLSILNQLNLREDMVVADFGCGSGGWTIPLAKKLEQGIIFAIDIQEEPLSALIGKAKSERLSNIKKIVADVEERIPQIKDDFCDLVLMTDLLFQIEKKEEVFKEAKRILKPEGKILIVEWKKNALFGPQEGRVSKEEVKKIAENLGFKIEQEFLAGDYHYGMILQK